MWELRLNDMRTPQVELLRQVIRANTRDELEAFLAREKVALYFDRHWRKYYRAGGPLEWFNRPYEREEDRHYVNLGSPSERAERARAKGWRVVGKDQAAPSITSSSAFTA